MSTLPLQFLILTVSGWVNRNQQDVIEYLQEENRVLRERIGDGRLPFTDSQRRRLAVKATGLRTVKLPARSPDLTAHAERFVRSIREECLRRVIPLGERHLRWVVREYVEHYHLERNHQGLGNELIEPLDRPGLGRVASRERLGWLLRYYYREAA